MLTGCGLTAATTPSPPAVISPSAPATLKITSSDLASGVFQTALTCDGADVAPQLIVASAPAGTKALALEMIDPDAPSGAFTHWVAYVDGSPPPTSAPFGGDAVHSGRNDAGKNGYAGPCPPAGKAHHYHLTVFAVASPLGVGGLGLGDGFSRPQLDAALIASGAVLAQGSLVATYSRT